MIRLWGEGIDYSDQAEAETIIEIAVELKVDLLMAETMVF